MSVRPYVYLIGLAVLPSASAIAQTVDSQEIPGLQEPMDGGTGIIDPKEEERRMQVMLSAEQMVQRFEDAEIDTLKANRKLIVKMLEDYSAMASAPQLLMPDLLLYNARSLPDDAGARLANTAWTNAILAEKSTLARVDLLFEAASELGKRGDRSSARTFLAQAKAFVESSRGGSDLLDIEFKVRELLVTGSNRDWREVEDEISDMRLLAGKFSVWTEEKLEILILEANLRLDAQPDENNKENRIRAIRSEVRLAYDSQTEPVKQTLKDRYRTLMRRIDDIYAFDARDPNPLGG